MYVSLFFNFVTFCSLQDRENAECLVFIHFGSQIDLKANPRSNTPHGQAKRRQITLKIKKSDPHPSALHTISPSLFTLKWHALFCLSLPVAPFGPVEKGKMGFLRCHFQKTVFFFETGWDFCFQHVCLACSIWCQFVNFSLLSLLSSNTRLRETWRAV